MPAGQTYSTTPIRTTYDGQVIENLDLWVSDGDAIRVENDNVIIRNVTIHHADGNGIVVEDASGVSVQNSLIVNSDPPTGNGGETDPETTGIRVVNAPNFTASHVTLQDSGTGIYLASRRARSCPTSRATTSTVRSPADSSSSSSSRPTAACRTFPSPTIRVTRMSRTTSRSSTART